MLKRNLDSTGAPEQERFAALIEAHKGIAGKVCRAYCKSPDERADLTQEIVLQAWRSFGSFDASRCLFSTWLYRVALNTAISSLRKESRRPQTGPLVADVASPAAESVEIQMLYSFIERLDLLNRALVLLYLDGNSHEEIASILGTTATNAATRIGRLKQRMKEEMG